MLLLFHLGNNSLECLRIIYSEVGKHLTIDLDVSLVKCTDKLRITQTLETCSSIDTLYPKSTEVTLFLATVNIGVGKTFFPCVFCNSPHILACTIITAS